jgi:hypothetical protein
MEDLLQFAPAIDVPALQNVAVPVEVAMLAECPVSLNLLHLDFDRLDARVCEYRPADLCQDFLP